MPSWDWQEHCCVCQYELTEANNNVTKQEIVIRSDKHKHTLASLKDTLSIQNDMTLNPTVFNFNFKIQNHESNTHTCTSVWLNNENKEDVNKEATTGGHDTYSKPAKLFFFVLLHHLALNMMICARITACYNQYLALGYQKDNRYIQF